MNFPFVCLVGFGESGLRVLFLVCLFSKTKKKEDVCVGGITFPPWPNLGLYPCLISRDGYPSCDRLRSPLKIHTKYSLFLRMLL